LRDIVYIIEEEIIDNMNCILAVQNISGSVLTVCDVKWSRVGLVLTDALAQTYTITAVDYVLNTITITPDGVYTFTGVVINLLKPYFFTGTPIATNKEWKSFSRDERLKLPMSWLLDPTEEDFKDDTNTIERESDILIVFLDSNNVNQWRTMDTHNNRLQALYNMVEEFIATIKREYLFHSIDLTYKTKNFTKFGKETSSGMEANIIDANLTGVEVRLTLPINRGNICC
jgi:hypothetical protein